MFARTSTAMTSKRFKERTPNPPQITTITFNDGYGCKVKSCKFLLKRSLIVLHYIPRQKGVMMNSTAVITKRFFAVLVFVLAITIAAHAQWDPYPWKNMPRTPDGKVDLNAPTRRTADGKPDLSGFWMPSNPVKHLLNLAADLKPEEIPLNASAKTIYDERIDNNGKDHPGARCLPSGIPEKLNIPDGLKLVQTPDLLIFLHESRTIYRQVFTDGRSLPKNAQTTWMGYSMERWEGDTLVVKTSGHNGNTWLDMRGLPGTESLRVIERYNRPNIGRMNIDVTIEDPSAYTKPWSVKLSWRLEPDTDLIESICEE